MPPAPSAARPPAVANALLTKLRRSWSRARDCRRRWLSYSGHDLSSPAHMGISLALHWSMSGDPRAVPGWASQQRPGRTVMIARDAHLLPGRGRSPERRFGHGGDSIAALMPKRLAAADRSLGARLPVRAGSELDAQEVSELADDAAAEQQHGDDEDRALHDEHPLPDRREVVLQRHHEERPHYRPEQGAEPADQRHQDHLAGHRPVDVGQRGELENQRLGRARDAREGRREHEGEELEAIGLVAERDRARLVLPDRLEHFPER